MTGAYWKPAENRFDAWGYTFSGVGLSYSRFVRKTLKDLEVKVR